ncbi:MAG: DnaJ domain-containing protein [Gemmatimonadota bacterium]|nr:DnaJ domain-containing protein [Gemmatimonadota bacterium]
MSAPAAQDHYEILQVSSRADRETIERVFRHLAKRYHPDNAESGDAARFNEVMQAYEVLSDPARRAKFDAGYAAARETRWRIFDQQTAANDLAADRRVRDAILSILYTARRNDAENPGVGIVDLERTLGCPETHMRFHLWYLKENRLVQRTESGQYAITAAGVDRVLELGGPVRHGTPLLEPGNGAAAAAS